MENSMNPREDRIRELAHKLWVEAGQPHGEHKRHWEEAERLVDRQLADSEGPLKGDPNTRDSPVQPGGSNSRKSKTRIRTK
jgi:hypothetical protein